MSLKNPSYEGLYGSNTIKLERDLLHIFPFGTIGEQFKGKIKLHAHPKLIQIFYITSGKTILHTGKFQHEIEGPAVIFVPKSYHHGFDHVQDVKGWIFSISELALAFRFQLDAPLLKWIDELHIKQLSTEERMTDTFQYIVENCVKEFHTNNIGRALMLQTLTYQIIVILSRLEEIQSVLITRSQTKALACTRALGLSDDDPRINRNGGAIAIGHPLGMSGTRITYTAALELQRTQGKYALATMCVGVGQGYAIILERV